MERVRWAAVVTAATVFVMTAAPPASASHSPAFLGNNPSGAATVRISATPSGSGYYLLDAVGGITTHGDAAFFGSVPGLRQSDPSIGQAAAIDLSNTTSGAGYWILDEVGGMFTFGDASFFGSVPGLRNAGVNIGPGRVVDLAPTQSNQGYFLLDEHGGAFTFGDAQFLGSVPQLRQQGVQIGPAPVIAIVPVPGGGGYWMVDAKGGIFGFGNAAFFGSLPGIGVDATAIAMAATPNGDGYWIATSDGGVHAFGKAGGFGSAAGLTFGATAVGFAASPHGTGYWVAFNTGQVIAFPNGLTEPPGSRTFRGTGTRVVSGFSLADGLAVFVLNHDGSSNFAVWLTDGAGNRKELLVNEIGKVVQFETSYGAIAGPHMLEVTADGSWTINISEPRNATGQRLPVTRGGKGSRVLGPLQGTRNVTFSYSHDGSSNFIVWLIDANGRNVDLHVNEIGATSGSVLANFNGVRYLEIDADGNWAVSAG